MKKLTSYFIGILMLFLNLNLCFAGGDDKILILSDGTKLTYVSSGNIHGVLQKIKELHEFYTNKKFSKNQNIAIKTVASSIGILDTMLTPILAYNACTGDNIKSDHPYLLTGAFIVGGIAILGSSIIGWMYPDNVNESINEKIKKFSYLCSSFEMFDNISEFINSSDGTLLINKCYQYKNGIEKGTERDFNGWTKIDRMTIDPEYNPYYGLIVVERPNEQSWYRLGVYTQYSGLYGTIKDKILSDERSSKLKVIKTIYPQ